MQITKSIAAEVAEKLCRKKEEQIENLKQELINIVGVHIKTLAPIEVLKIYNSKHKEYIECANHVNLSGGGLSWYSLDLGESVPLAGGRNSLQIGDWGVACTKIVSLTHKIDKCKDEYSKLKLEVIATLVGLRTYKRIAEEFEEAVEFLPERNTCTALSINISEVRKQLKD